MEPYDSALRGRQQRQQEAAFPPDYKGPRMWWVEHPEHPMGVSVRAPTSVAATVAAAAAWGMEWTDSDVHGLMTVKRLR